MCTICSGFRKDTRDSECTSIDKLAQDYARAKCLWTEWDYLLPIMILICYCCHVLWDNKWFYSFICFHVLCRRHRKSVRAVTWLHSGKSLPSRSTSSCWREPASVPRVECRPSEVQEASGGNGKHRWYDKMKSKAVFTPSHLISSHLIWTDPNGTADPLHFSSVHFRWCEVRRDDVSSVMWIHLKIYRDSVNDDSFL